MKTPEAAKRLRARGFALCRPDPAEKKPTYKGWPTRSLEPDDFGAGDMMGVIGGPLSDGGKPGHALVIIDLDTAEAIARADDFLFSTGMEEGRAGKRRSHRYYLVPVESIPDWAKSTAEQGAAAATEKTGHPGPFTKSFRHRGTKAEVFRIVGTGGQCVCPPSIWASEDGTRTEPREWEGGEPGDPAVVPFLDLWRVCGELASACGARIPAEPPRPPTGRTRPPATPVIERARKYLDKIPGAVSGRGGHDQTFAAACSLVWGFDLGPDLAFQLLREAFNPRCEPPWSEAELRHKCEDAERVPRDKPRGWLRDSENGKPTNAKAPRTRSPRQSAENAQRGSSDETGAAIILDYFGQRYRPDFRVRGSIHCEDGSIVSRVEACDCPDSEIIQRLAQAIDAPKRNDGEGGLKVNWAALPGFFRTWSRVAFDDLLKALPDEDTAELGEGSLAGCEFRRMVSEVLLSQLTLGEVQQDLGGTITQRRSVLNWCQMIAVKPGRWQQLRSFHVWFRCTSPTPGELRLDVAIQQSAFAALGADRELRSMTADTFARRARRYRVGETSRVVRPGGQRCVILSRAFLDGLLDCGPLDETATPEDFPQSVVGQS